MLILPAIDLYDGKAVRLYKGDYARMTVYSNDPLAVARDFEDAGAEYIHMVDLAGARDGSTPNFDVVAAVARETGLRVEIGGGVRSEEVVRKYLDAGVERVILGTAAITDISKDGAMRGTNRSLYSELTERFPDLNIIASGGVSALDDIRALRDMGLHGAIVGKAYYVGAIDLREAIEVSK